MFRIRAALAIGFCYIFSAANSIGAQSATLKRAGCSISILGDLAADDDKRFLDLAIEVAQISGCANGVVMIASKGGNLHVAMEIGRIIRELHWSTGAPTLFKEKISAPEPAEDARRICSWIPGEEARIAGETARNEAARKLADTERKANPPTSANNYRTPQLKLDGRLWTFDPATREGDPQCVCASACFFIWLAGAERDGGGIQIHRPYFDPSFYKRLGLDQAQTAYLALAIDARKYLREMGASDGLIDRMFAIDSERSEYVSKGDRQSLTLAPYMKELKHTTCPVEPARGEKVEPGIGGGQFKHLNTEQRQKAFDEVDLLLRKAKADLCWSKNKTTLFKEVKDKFLGRIQGKGLRP